MSEFFDMIWTMPGDLFILLFGGLVFALLLWWTALKLACRR